MKLPDVKAWLGRHGWVGPDGVIGGTLVDTDGPLAGRDKVQHATAAWVLTVIAVRLCLWTPAPDLVAVLIGFVTVQVGGVGIEYLEEHRLRRGKTTLADRVDPNDLKTNFVFGVLALPFCW